MNMKRMRGRNHRSGGGGGGGGFRNQQNGIPLNRNHVFDSSGPEMRVRGTAQQLYEKYTQLARDASGGGDRILAEAYYQHAEHYFRIIAAINAAQGQNGPGQNNQNHGQNNHNGEYQRREGDEGQNGEPRPERQEFRQERPERQEFRNEPRRFDNNNHNRPPRPEFQPRNRDERNDRQDRPFRPQPQPVDAPIDISSALEAELQAAVAPQGLGEQPVVQELPLPAPTPRAIPIVSDAPPAPVAEEPAAPVRRPRGRPRTVKVEVEPAGE